MKIKKHNPEEIISYLPLIYIFKHLNSEEKRNMANLCELLEYDAKDKIVSEGEISPYLYAVVKGAVSVMVHEKNGKDVYISSIGENDIFGEAGIFINVKRIANVIADDPTIILRIERNRLIQFIRENPSAGIKMLLLVIYSLLHKLREANQDIAFERKSYINQEEVDKMISELFK